MNDLLSFEAPYRHGFRAALSTCLSKQERQTGRRDLDLHRRRWRARCVALGELSGAFPFLEGYFRFGFRRASCDARDVLSHSSAEATSKESNPDQIFRCNQRWVCPWCSTRSTIKVIRKVFLSLKAHKDDLAGMVWTLRGWRWDLGPIDSATPQDLDKVLDSLTALRAKASLAVCRNTGGTAALISRIRCLPGRTRSQGSTPPLVVSCRVAFLSKPGALIVRRWTDRFEKALPGSQPDDPSRPAFAYADLCRFLAGYPPALAFCSPLSLAHLLRVRDGLRTSRKLVGCAMGV